MAFREGTEMKNSMRIRRFALTCALALLSLAATMDLTLAAIDGHPAVVVRLTNETGHKLPSGYPEGRRTWVNVKAFDSNGSLVYESGAYDPNTGILTEDEDAKIYLIKPGFTIFFI